MDITLKTAAVSAIVTICISFITIMFNFYKERSEKEKWKRTLELEARKVEHEENKWAVDLIITREIKLFEKRIETYPQLFSVLKKFSKINLRHVEPKDIEPLISELDGYIYGEIGLYMLSDTRDALVKFRNDCNRVFNGDSDLQSLRRGSRTDLLELMRRDLSHKLRFHKNKSLISINRDQILSLLEDDINEKTI